jgi:hypothetical protein
VCLAGYIPMTDAAASLTDGPFSGPAEFAQLVRAALASAAHEGWHSMVWSDADFDDWPLREKAVVDSLHTWSRKGGRLTLLARSYDSVQRNQHRFVQWRGLWDHLVDCRVCKHLDASEFPSALWSPTWGMRRLDVVRSTGVAGTEPQWRVLLREELEECRRQSSPGFPATILGL